MKFQEHKILQCSHLFCQIIRLVPSMRIYVSECSLENAISESSKPTILARALLYVVFKSEALEICYATGKNGSKKISPCLTKIGSKQFTVL